MRDEGNYEIRTHVNILIDRYKHWFIISTVVIALPFKPGPNMRHKHEQSNNGYKNSLLNLLFFYHSLCS